jgi:hypothetical protein
MRKGSPAVRIATHILCVLLAVILFGAYGVSQSADGRDAATENIPFARNRCLSKGGVGIIATDLYIAVKSVKNVLLFGKDQTWTGLDASRPEIAIFFDSKIWSPQGLPKHFDLSKAVVVSFEKDRVRFLDFRKMSGGYYERIRD